MCRCTSFGGITCSAVPPMAMATNRSRPPDVGVNVGSVCGCGGPDCVSEVPTWVTVWADNLMQLDIVGYV